MTSIIRIKRRIDEDPAEALLVSCKKRRATEENTELESVLSFAGTLRSKDEPVSDRIKAAIRQKKIQTELHAKTADFKHSRDSQRVISSLRDQKAQTSSKNRYRVICAKRALDLSQLDEENEQGNKNTESLERLENSFGEKSTDKEKAESVVSSSQEIHPPQTPETSATSTRFSDEAKTGALSNKNESGKNAESVSENSKLFCIFDVENDGVTDKSTAGVGGISQQSASGITVNNVPMTCRKASPEPTDDSQFVYDLYYTHSNLSGMDMEAVLTVEALCDELINDEGDIKERDFVYDESDDSNEESNWRNDYPDEDPRFFENEDEEADDYYAEDMVETNFLMDDEGDLLTYYMNSKCNIDGRSDDDEDEYEDDCSERSDAD